MRYAELAPILLSGALRIWKDFAPPSSQGTLLASRKMHEPGSVLMKSGTTEETSCSPPFTSRSLSPSRKYGVVGAFKSPQRSKKCLSSVDLSRREDESSYVAVSVSVNHREQRRSKRAEVCSPKTPMILNRRPAVKSPNADSSLSHHRPSALYSGQNYITKKLSQDEDQNQRIRSPTSATLEKDKSVLIRHLREVADMYTRRQSSPPSPKHRVVTNGGGQPGVSSRTIDASQSRVLRNSLDINPRPNSSGEANDTEAYTLSGCSNSSNKIRLAQKSSLIRKLSLKSFREGSQSESRSLKGQKEVSPENFEDGENMECNGISSKYNRDSLTEHPASSVFRSSSDNSLEPHRKSSRTAFIPTPPPNKVWPNKQSQPGDPLSSTALPHSIHRASTAKPVLFHPEVLNILGIEMLNRQMIRQYEFRTKTGQNRIVGLANLGNTCFMNSILQCIFSTEVLMGYFISGAYKEDVNHGSPLRGQLANAFSDLVNEFSHGNHARVVYASKFKRAIELRTTQFSGNGQQDSQEFLRFMLDGLHEDLNRVTTRPKFTYKDADVDMLRYFKKDASVNISVFTLDPATGIEQFFLGTDVRSQAAALYLLLDIFGGQYESTVTCHTCHHKSRTFDTFWDLSLQIPRSSHESRSKSAASEKCCTLIDCLRAYSAEEELETPYNCEKCRSYQLASKSLRIYRCPEILVIHLKRFSNEMSRSAKIETNVLFPIENMSVNVALSTLDGHDTDMTYDLYGMSNHYGGLGGGHYVAYCKNVEDNTWYLRNDTVIQRICPENTSSVDLATAIRGAGSSAYVLFYKKRAKEV